MKIPPPIARRARWSWSVGSLAGIDVRIHGTFLILLGWIVLSHVLAGHGIVAALEGMLVVATVFGVVVLHEAGHALVARRFGILTRDITLFPIGGVARLERMPTDPRQELLVALAGPAVNLALASFTGIAILLLNAPWSPQAVSVVGGPLVTKFLWLNVGLAVFNLLPAFPMDGGRVLRALLATRTDRIHATDIAARVARWMALGFGLLGLFGNPMLLFIALFVWIGSGAESALVHMSAALESVRVEDAMVTQFESLPAAASIAQGAERALRSVQDVFPVIDDWRLVGIVSSEELVRAMSEQSSSVAVAAITHPLGAIAAPADSVEVAIARMQETGDDVMPVVQAGRLVGLLVPKKVAELALLRERRRTPSAARDPQPALAFHT